MTTFSMSRKLFKELQEDLPEVRKFTGNETKSDHEIMLGILLEDLTSPDDEYEDGPPDAALENFCSFIGDRVGSIRIEISEDELSTILHELCMASSRYLSKVREAGDGDLKRGYELLHESTAALYDKLHTTYRKESYVKIK